MTHRRGTAWGGGEREERDINRSMGGTSGSKCLVSKDSNSVIITLTFPRMYRSQRFSSSLPSARHVMWASLMMMDALDVENTFNTSLGCRVCIPCIMHVVYIL